VPEEESEDKSDTENPEPRDDHERSAFNVGEMVQDGHPLWNLTRRLGKNFTLHPKLRERKSNG
jgi:hypothetical protein